MKKIALFSVLFITALCALQAQNRPRLAILPFTGSNAEDAESLAEFFSFEPEINRNFTPVPRTRAVENIMKEQRFQRSGLTDSDTISELGKQMNADFVLAGHITSLGTSRLLLITIIHVEQLRQVSGDYREYRRIEETVDFLPDMAKRIAAASRQDASRLPKLAVLPFNAMSSAVNQADAEVLAQILATDVANTGKYAVYPRTKTIETVMAEHHIQRSGMTDPENIRRIGAAVNTQYLLNANFRNVGADMYFSASVLHIERADQTGGTFKKYQSVSDGLTLIAELAKELTGAAVESGTNTAIPANFVRIEGGTFQMGSPANEPERRDNETQRQVTVSSFNMGKYEVTQKEYQEIMGTNPSSFKGESFPVENVSWYDTIEYCNRRSQKEGLTPAYTIDKSRSDPNNQNSNDNVRWVVTWNRNVNGYRLPTEAEWEYACRAGTRTPFNTGNNITTNLANYDGNNPYNNNAKGIYREKTTAVGSFPANPWGLHDMHGNVWEWCWDWFGNYPNGAQTDPQGASSGSSRVMRGGSWYGSAANVRSAYRNSFTPSYRNRYIGFRLVRP